MLRFRRADPGDIEAVVELVESAYRGDASRAGWTTEADLLDGRRTDTAMVGDLLADPASIVLLAESDGLVGCCNLQRRERGEAHLGMFAVRPVLQGQGVGRAVLAEAGRIVTSWGCHRLSMSVLRQRSELISWYARMGFVPTGETQPFPYGDERFGRPRRDDLEFLVLAAPVRPVLAGSQRADPRGAPAGREHRRA